MKKALLVRKALLVSRPPAAATPPGQGLARRRDLRVGVALAALLGAGLIASARSARTAGGPVAVSVANTVTGRDADNPARQPFLAVVSLLLPDGDFAVSDASTTVPAGKRLVIETVSLRRRGTLTSGQSVQASVSPANNGVFGFFPLPYVPATSAPLPGISQPMRLYADPSSIVHVDAYRTGSSGTETDEVAISGYLVNVP